MSTAQEFIDQIISTALQTATEQTLLATNASSALINKTSGRYVEPPDSEARFEVEAEEPDIPSTDDSTLTYEAQLEKLIELLSGQMADFFLKYYPLASDAFDEATSWLVNTITNGGTGINAGIEDQIWQRGRERVVADGRRAMNQVATGFSAKGYFMAPGAMTKEISRSLYEQSGNNGIASTAIASKQLDLEIDTIKFAIGKAIDSRTMAMNAAADYIRAIATAPDAAARVAGLNTDSQAKMVSAYSTWYSTRLDRDKIVLSSKLAEMSSRDDIYKHKRDNYTKNDQVEVTALTAAADVLGGSARAALSSLNSIVSSAANAFS